ncbi:MAG TPA: glycoside hydrolase family 38 C-terminal domain-containing protein [Bryobacteraceae bacterium]|nr:glycoside hydrolase family 38 C-terminal domain-containing protein [Bryobacteraceae bacterium]
MGDFTMLRRSIALLVGVAATLLPARMLPAADRDLVMIVPHTHWEGAVFKTREEYLDIGLPHILEALRLLKQNPDYRFVLDQMCYVKPFLDRYPNEAGLFREMLEQHRLEIAGGTDTMHDNNVPSGESIARQYLFGKHYFRDRLGYDVKTGWGLDTFGHNAQMPQILKLAGMNSYWFQRGVAGPDTPSEILWQGIDGTRIPGYWLPLGYGALYDTPRRLPDFEARMQSIYDGLSPFVRGRGRVVMAGADVVPPEEQLPALVKQANAAGALPFELQFALPSAFNGLMEKLRPNRPVFAGELNPVFQGIYSTRIEVKQSMREMERLLTSAEKLDVLAGRISSTDRDALEQAWEPVLFNEAHDLSSGVMLDNVYADSMDRYRQAKYLAGSILDRRLEDVLKNTDTRGPGLPVAVYNLLGWPRTDLAQAEVGFTGDSIRQIVVLDPAGKAIPSQTIREQRDEQGLIVSATIAFLAREVPAMGFAVYRVVDASQAPHPAQDESLGAPANSQTRDSGALENEFYKATVDLWTGAVTSVILKQDRWEALSGPGNVVAREEDGGDFWELYGTLNGARFAAMKRPIGAPDASAVLSSRNVGGNGSVRVGPVFSEFHVSHPFGKNHFTTRVRVYPGIRRIDFHTEIQNQEKFVRYRLMFPVSVSGGHNVQEIPFGAIERPLNQEFPAQNWIDYGAEGHGVALLNRGLPGSNVAGNTMLLSLMRSTRLLSYGGVSDDPNSQSDTALELGKQIGFDYALVPHAGTWQDAKVFRDGFEFNNPLVTRTGAVHPGPLPARWGLLRIEGGDHVVISALKPSRDGEVAVRVYEAAGIAAPGVKMHFTVPLRSAREANLIEDPAATLPLQDNSFSFDLRPFEIKTFRLRLDAAAQGSAHE